MFLRGFENNRNKYSALKYMYFRRDNESTKYVTQNVYVNYLTNVKDQEVIYAEGTVVRRGNVVTVVHAIVRTEDGQLLAEGTVDMFRLDSNDERISQQTKSC